jgi:Holliday junction resolvase RusA-like endonuclease
VDLHNGVRAMTLTIRVPGTPQGKGRPRFTKTGRVYTPAKTKAYENAIGWAARAVHKGDPISGPVIVRVIANMPVPASWPKAKRASALVGDVSHTGKPDIDNLMKAALDALNGIVWRDDSQITFADVTKRYSSEPELVILVKTEGEP